MLPAAQFSATEITGFNTRNQENACAELYRTGYENTGYKYKMCGSFFIYLLICFCIVMKEVL